MDKADCNDYNYYSCIKWCYIAPSPRTTASDRAISSFFCQMTNQLKEVSTGKRKQGQSTYRQYNSKMVATPVIQHSLMFGELFL